MDLIEHVLETSEIDPDEVKEIQQCFKGVRDLVRVGPSGFVYPKYEELLEHLLFVRNIQLRESDTFVISFPRSGTTMTLELVWLIGNNLDYETASSRHIYERYFILRTHKPDDPLKKAMDLEKYQQIKCKFWKAVHAFISPPTNIADITDSRFMFSHNPLLLQSPDILKTSKVVYIARNPLDVAVSLFHLMRLLKLFEYVGDFKTFWNLFIKDLIPWTPYFAHVKQSWEKRHHPNMLFLFYEDYIKDLPTAVRRISTFLNKSYSDEQINGLCKHMNFQNFKKNGSVNLDFLKEFDVLVPFEQPFIRKGKTGGWRDYFDEEMTTQAAYWIKDNLRDTDLRFPELDVILETNS